MAQLLLPEQEEAQNQLLTPQQQTQQQPQHQGRNYDSGGQQQQQQQEALQLNIPASTRPLPSAIHARPSSPQRSPPAQRPSPSLGRDIGVGGLRGPSAEPPSAPPPCKLPRGPPDLSSRLAAVLQNINPPRSAPSPWQPVSHSTEPGLPSPATPAAPAVTASATAARPFPMSGSSSAVAAPATAPATTTAAAATAAAVAAAAVAVAVASAVSCIKAPESRLVVGGSRGGASAVANTALAPPGLMGSTLPSSAVHTSNAAAYGYNQRVQWPASFSSNNALSRIRLSAARINPRSPAPGSAAEHSAASRASVATPHVVAFGPERPLRVDASGMLPRPMCGAREGMLKQQLMALAEAMAVDDSVRGARVKCGGDRSCANCGAPVAGSNSFTRSGSMTGSDGSTHSSSPTTSATLLRPTAHVKFTAVDFGIIRVEEHPTGLVHLGGQYLEQVASMMGLSLSFHGIETTPLDFHPSQVEVDEGEEVIVLANWSLMVFPDDSVLRSNPRNAILKWIRDLQPLLLLQVDIDLDANGPFFLSRFHAAFANFAASIESIDASMPHSATSRFAAETILARDLMNGVACEGMNRWLRSERLEKWVHRMRAVGLEPVPLGPDTVAAGKAITEGKDGRFRLEVHAETGALQLSWRGVPLIFVAAWR
ncbi:unnamed protein product [Closterium sp. Naga37s-1]|nr:unnamed protein product [Closterium sp. Naga37s-1]